MKLDKFDAAFLGIAVVMVVSMVTINWPPQPPWWVAGVVMLAGASMFAIVRTVTR